MQTRLQRSLKRCSICYQSVSTQGQLEVCAHVFCISCINTWAEKQNTCPICKRRFHNIRQISCRINYCLKTKKIKHKTIKIGSKDQMECGITISSIIRFDRLLRLDELSLFDDLQPLIEWEIL